MRSSPLCQLRPSKIARVSKGIASQRSPQCNGRALHEEVIVATRKTVSTLGIIYRACNHIEVQLKPVYAAQSHSFGLLCKFLMTRVCVDPQELKEAEEAFEGSTSYIKVAILMTVKACEVP